MSPELDDSEVDSELLVARYERVESRGRPNYWMLAKELTQGSSPAVGAVAALIPSVTMVGMLWLSPKIVATAWHTGGADLHRPTTMASTYFPESLVAPPGHQDQNPSTGAGTTIAEVTAEGGSARTQSLHAAAESTPVGDSLVAIPQYSNAPDTNGKVPGSVQPKPNPPSSLSIDESTGPQ